MRWYDSKRKSWSHSEQRLLRMDESLTIGKMTENLLGVKMTGDAKKSRHIVEKKSAKKEVRDDSDDEEVSDESSKGRIPWFLIISIVVLIVVVGVAGFMAYKYWKRRQEEIANAQTVAVAEVHVPVPAPPVVLQPQQKAQMQSVLSQALTQAPVAPGAP
jgi:cytoskeletal protein RodZ